MSWFSKKKDPPPAVLLGVRIEDLAQRYATDLSNLRHTLTGAPLSAGELGSFTMALSGMLCFFADYLACDRFGPSAFVPFAGEVKSSLLYALCARAGNGTGKLNDYEVRALISKHGDRIVEVLSAAGQRVGSGSGFAGALEEACSFATQLLVLGQPKNDEAAKTIRHHSLTLFRSAIDEMKVDIGKAAPSA